MSNAEERLAQITDISRQTMDDAVTTMSDTSARSRRHWPTDRNNGQPDASDNGVVKRQTGDGE